MLMVALVVNDPNHLDAVLEAWHAIGIDGVTILETSGLHRRRHQVLGARYAFAFPILDGSRYGGHFTLLTAVPDRAAVDASAAAAEKVVGDLSEPNTGVLFAWPLEVVHGVPDVPEDA